MGCPAAAAAAVEAVLRKVLCCWRACLVGCCWLHSGVQWSQATRPGCCHTLLPGAVQMPRRSLQAVPPAHSHWVPTGAAAAAAGRMRREGQRQAAFAGLHACRAAAAGAAAAGAAVRRQLRTRCCLWRLSRAAGAGAAVRHAPRGWRLRLRGAAAAAAAVAPGACWQWPGMRQRLHLGAGLPRHRVGYGPVCVLA